MTNDNKGEGTMRAYHADARRGIGAGGSAFGVASAIAHRRGQRPDRSSTGPATRRRNSIRTISRRTATPTFTFFGDEDEAFEKLRAGFKADLAHPCSQSVVKWREAGLLQPLDTSKIAGWNDLNPGIMAMKDLATTADGTAWFMPWDWGNTLLTYNTEKVDAKDVQSLKAFADPKFKDRVSIGDNVDDAYALASLAIGLKDWTKMTDEQFTQASAFLREVHKNVRLYWTDTTEIVQAMSGGEVDLAWAWNDAARAGGGRPARRSRSSATRPRACRPGSAAMSGSRMRRAAPTRPTTS